MKFEVMEITPEMAKEFLKGNVNNRRISKHTVAELVERMKLGEFITTHQGVARMYDGNLVDGQHRLQAIVESGTTQKVVVTTYEETDASKEQIYMALDGNMPRGIDARLVYTSLPEWLKVKPATSFVKRVSQIYLSADAKGSPEYHKKFCINNLEAIENFERDIPGAYKLLGNISASLFAAYVSGVDKNDLIAFVDCYKNNIVDTNYGYRHALELKEFANDTKIKKRTNGAAIMVQNAIYSFVKNLKNAKHSDELLYGVEYFAEQKKAVSVAADTAKEKEV